VIPERIIFVSRGITVYVNPVSILYYIKFQPTPGCEGPDGENMYSSTLSLTSTLDGVGDQRHAPAALPTGMARYPLYRRLVGPQGQSAFGDDAMSRAQAFRWHKVFSESRTHIEDGQRSG